MTDTGDSPIQFDDGKSPDAMRTIGEVASALNLRQHVLRYWEEQFPMLRPVKRSGGRRYYRPEDVRLIADINRLVHLEGYTLRGARQALSKRGSASADSARPTEPSLIESAAEGAQAAGMDAATRTTLSTIRGRLADALAAA